MTVIFEALRSWHHRATIGTRRNVFAVLVGSVLVLTSCVSGGEATVEEIAQAEQCDGAFSGEFVAEYVGDDFETVETEGQNSSGEGFFCLLQAAEVYASLSVMGSYTTFRDPRGGGYRGEVPLGGGLDGMVSYDRINKASFAHLAIRCDTEPSGQLLVLIRAENVSEEWRSRSVSLLISVVEVAADVRGCSNDDARARTSPAPLGSHENLSEIDECGGVDAEIVRRATPMRDWKVERTASDSFPTVGCRLHSEVLTSPWRSRPSDHTSIVVSLGVYRGALGALEPPGNIQGVAIIPLGFTERGGGFNSNFTFGWSSFQCSGVPVYYSINLTTPDSARDVINEAVMRSLFEEWVRADTVRAGCALP